MLKFSPYFFLWYLCCQKILIVFHEKIGFEVKGKEKFRFGVPPKSPPKNFCVPPCIPPLRGYAEKLSPPPVAETLWKILLLTPHLVVHTLTFNHPLRLISDGSLWIVTDCKGLRRLYYGL